MLCMYKVIFCMLVVYQCDIYFKRYQQSIVRLEFLDYGKSRVID